MNVQYYDLFMVLVLVGATIFGFWKGMAWQIASLASLVVSIFVAAKFRNQLAPMFGQQAPMNQFAAMLAIYAGSSFVIWMAFRFVSGAIDKVKLQAFDKQMGALFGFAKGVLMCVAITFFAITLLPQVQGQAIVNSKSGHYIVAFLNQAETMVPPEYHQAIVPYLDKVEERISTGNPNGWPRVPAWVAEWIAGGGAHRTIRMHRRRRALAADRLAGVATADVAAAEWLAAAAGELAAKASPVGWPTQTPHAARLAVDDSIATAVAATVGLADAGSEPDGLADAASGRLAAADAARGCECRSVWCAARAESVSGSRLLGGAAGRGELLRVQDSGFRTVRTAGSRESVVRPGMSARIIVAMVRMKGGWEVSVPRARCSAAVSQWPQAGHLSAPRNIVPPHSGQTADSSRVIGIWIVDVVGPVFVFVVPIVVWHVELPGLQRRP